MAEAQYKYGEYESIPYTPSAGDVAAGEVVLLGNTTGLTCGIAHSDITNNTLGSLAIGGGVYEVTNLNNAADYATVYWDTSANKVTTTSTNMMFFGYVVEDGAGGANTACLAYHNPKVA